MNEIIVYVALVLFGACLGSYGAATVWRLRAKQLKYDKAHEEPYDKKEYDRLKKLLTKKGLQDRSRCLECGTALRWYELIPIVSWLALRGRCRTCKHRIGWFEFLMEVGVAAFFVLSYALWPEGLDSGFEIAHFIAWLVAGVVMAIMFAYDVKWLLLPNILNFSLIGIGVVIVALEAAQAPDAWQTVLNALGAVAALGGLYAVLYFVSRGRWVGFGDVKLGVGLGLLLGDWQLAFVALFLANFIGCLIVIPLMATKKIGRHSHIPFGPLLMAGAVLAWFFGWSLLDFYLSILSM